MKGLILTAGIGSRLNDLTLDKPKTLLELNGVTILKRTLKSLSDIGVKDVIILLGYESDLVKKTIESYTDLDLSITYVINHDFRTTNNIYSVYLASDLLINEDFILLNGDVIFETNILEKLRDDPYDFILSVDTQKDLGDEEMKIKVNQEGKIMEISKELDHNDSHGEYIGILKVQSSFSKQFFDSITEVINKDGKNVYYESALKNLIDKSVPIWVSDIKSDKWFEIDTVDDYTNAQSLFKSP